MPVESNYVAWKFQITAILKAHSLIGYVDGSFPSPDKFIRNEQGNITTQVNPNYHLWNTQDQALMTPINATLSQSALSHVIGYTTSREVWLALERRFSSSSRSNILQLKSSLHNISKGKDNIDTYIQKIKQAMDNLAAASVLMDDEDILIHILNGLPQEYNPFNLEEIYAMLKIEEQSLESSHKQDLTPAFPAATMASNYRPPYPSNNKGHKSPGHGRGIGRFGYGY
ncbi:hypothetical protein F0562_001845 [Nyssa sinensis]|uniref:Uncharacterized protein n=1 Tax=Nyssa sinensis TaxID=561372 RepID=A0A5J5C4R7_9ASTE|nr:hypothetical protein F0562_001845 [Nyssa sinensis]